jgi:hypothetical protein
MWVDSALNTSMTVAVMGESNTPIGIWSGLTPFQSTTISWGQPNLRQPYQFVGYGVPVPDPPGSIPGIGDTYLDLSTGNLYEIVP